MEIKLNCMSTNYTDSIKRDDSEDHSIQLKNISKFFLFDACREITEKQNQRHMLPASVGTRHLDPAADAATDARRLKIFPLSRLLNNCRRYVGERDAREERSREQSERTAQQLTPYSNCSIILVISVLPSTTSRQIVISCAFI